MSLTFCPLFRRKSIFDGKKYSLYEATQLQRKNETEQRKERGKLAIINDVAGNDPAFKKEKQEAKDRIKELRGDYNRLGLILAPYSIIKKPGRSYNVNARKN
jgi:hypothetical protein